jgi:hypothetical protein
MLHRRIVSRHEGLGENSGNRGVETGLLQFGLQRLLQKISDLTLGRCSAHVERMTGNLARSSFRTQKRRPHLRTIAMREHDSETATDQSDDLHRCPSGIGPLLGNGSLFARANEGVSANGKEHGLHKRPTSFSHCCYTCINSCNSKSPGNLTNSPFINSSMIAFWACSRFSAC